MSAAVDMSASLMCKVPGAARCYEGAPGVWVMAVCPGVAGSAHMSAWYNRCAAWWAGGVSYTVSHPTVIQPAALSNRTPCM